jgi:thiopeptide-type bacteriocin biosynthesis protein
MNQQTGHNEYVPSGFFAIRTPLLPFDELLSWSSDLKAVSAGNNPARLQAALTQDRTLLRQRLQAVFARPETRDALFVASPGLEEHLDRWFREPESDQGQKVEKSLVRYFARMAGRATPFGLFAGCSVGFFGTETRLVLKERVCYRRHTRLDMDYLVLLTDSLTRQSNLRHKLKFRPNTSLYRARGCYRFFEVRRDGKGWTHHLVGLEASDYLELTLANAKEGATVQALAAGLLEIAPDSQLQEAEEYIGGLIDNQILVSEFVPAVTGPEPISELTSRLLERSAIMDGDLREGFTEHCDPVALKGGEDSTDEGIAARLDRVQQCMKELDTSGVGAAPAQYRRVAQLLGRLPAEVDLARLFQVDMVKPVTKASLGPAVLEEIQRGVMILHRLARRPRDDRLDRFREAFVTRYEGRVVPLVEALDEETGVGFDSLDGQMTDASSLLDGLSFPKSAMEQAVWSHRESCLLRKLVEALGSSATEIVLEPEDLEGMAEKKPPPLPAAFAVMATLAAASETALAAGEFQVLFSGLSGPSGARLLGRFCGTDPQLHTMVNEHLRAEEALDAEAIFAEIIHLPEGRLGNILARPILRDYEIPYLGQASVPPEQQIAVTDLRIAVAGGRIILTSSRLGRRVTPRLTSAHNFHTSHGIYRFLCALQGHGIAGDLAWDWGPLRSAPFLPRVVSGQLVLCRASWRARPDELKQFVQASGFRCFQAVQAWRDKRRLPRWIALAEGDNELPIDLDNVQSIETFVELVKGRQEATLLEFFPGSDQLCARGPEGHFTHELVVPFIARRENGAKMTASAAELELIHRPAFILNSSSRSFPPGSEWLYVKLYTGPATVDQALRDVVTPVVEKMIATGAADRWFFVRYGDPDWHLRLRFHGRSARLQEEIFPVLQATVAPLLTDGRIWRFQLDTYEREVERYGGPEGILLAEQVFQADSEAVLELAARLPEDTRGDVRWRLGIVGMDLLLRDLGFDLDAKCMILRKTRAAFAGELKVDAKFRHKLGEKFRLERKSLETVLDLTSRPDAQLAESLEVLRRRSERLAPIISELKACAQSGSLSVPLVDLAASYLHMHVNRILRSAHRAQELVLYDFLGRLYESQSARAREQVSAGSDDSPTRMS